jgi:hypothetical protein
MTFTLWEWVRLLCYLIAVCCLPYMVLRRRAQRNSAATMFYAGLTLLFAWNLFDLTMLAWGLSTRETRSFATPVIVFATGGIVLMVWREVRRHRDERRVSGEIDRIEQSLKQLG